MLSKREINEIADVVINSANDNGLLSDSEYTINLILDVLDDISGFESLDSSAMQKYLSEILECINETIR